MCRVAHEALHQGLHLLPALGRGERLGHLLGRVQGEGRPETLVSIGQGEEHSIVVSARALKREGSLLTLVAKVAGGAVGGQEALQSAQPTAGGGITPLLEVTHADHPSGLLVPQARRRVLPAVAVTALAAARPGVEVQQPLVGLLQVLVELRILLPQRLQGRLVLQALLRLPLRLLLGAPPALTVAAALAIAAALLGRCQAVQHLLHIL